MDEDGQREGAPLGHGAAAGRDSESLTLVVWDYDWSLIDTNSDTYVVEELCPQLNERFGELHRRGLGWTDIMDCQMEGIWRAGVTRSSIESCVAGVPTQRGCREAVELAGAQPGRVEQIILSDANTFFIEAFLEGSGLRRHFSDVITNGAAFDVDGRLRVTPYCRGGAHGCALCPPNLCKGAVLAAVRAQREGVGRCRVVYIGDGGGDFCPACELRADDVVLCRAPPPPGGSGPDHYGLQARIRRSAVDGCGLLTRSGGPAVVQAQVRFWSTGDDVLSSLRELLVAGPPPASATAAAPG